MRSFRRWCQFNLFASVGDTILTLIAIPLCLWTVYELADWVLFVARWDVISGSIKVLMSGTYPPELLWRAKLSTLILFALVGAALGMFGHKASRQTLACGTAVTVAGLVAGFCSALNWAWVFLCGAALAAAFTATARTQPRAGVTMLTWLVGLIAIFVILSSAGTEYWGGLLLSVLVTVVVSILSIPLGVLLALGRRSRLTSLRICCTAYIEVMRSVPLILVVYCVWVFTPLLLAYSVPDLMRGMFGFSLFFAAYVAEYVRSGLQGVPKGQIEAARSLGMSNRHINVDIVLPQAARIVIPALAGNVLDVFNAVPLVFIIGLTDFLKAGQMVLLNPAYGDRVYEVYTFMFAVYLAIGFLITFGARKLERQLQLGGR